MALYLRFLRRIIHYSWQLVVLVDTIHWFFSLLILFLYIFFLKPSTSTFLKWSSYVFIYSVCLPDRNFIKACHIFKFVFVKFFLAFKRNNLEWITIKPPKMKVLTLAMKARVLRKKRGRLLLVKRHVLYAKFYLRNFLTTIETFHTCFHIVLC